MDKLISKIKESLGNGENVKIAIVGYTGSGKSMVAKSICENIFPKFSAKNILFERNGIMVHGAGYILDEICIKCKIAPSDFENLDNNLVIVTSYKIFEDELRLFDYLIEMETRDFKNDKVGGSVYSVEVVEKDREEDEIIKTKVMDCTFKRCSDKLKAEYDIKISDAMRELRKQSIEEFKRFH